MNPRYYRLSQFFQEKFGRRVWKVSVDAGFGCPNRGGCVFCDAASFSPSRRVYEKEVSIREQIGRGIEHLRRRHEADRFIAYFQPSTNTYGPVDFLRQVYTEAIEHPDVVGLAIGTRPDCVPDEVFELLDELAQRTWVSLELGLQSIHDRSLAWLGRGHDHAAFLDAVERCRQFSFDVGAHLILGIPGESREETLATADELTRLEIDSVKLHNLYVVRGTPLAEMYRAGEFRLGTLDEYVDLVVAFLERLRPECVIDRLSGEAPSEYLVAPEWCAKKMAVLQRIEAMLVARHTWQGRLVAR